VPATHTNDAYMAKSPDFRTLLRKLNGPQSRYPLRGFAPTYDKIMVIIAEQVAGFFVSPHRRRPLAMTDQKRAPCEPNRRF